MKGTFKIVHRLDQSASGLMFVAKSRNFAGYFGKLIEDKENLVKEYICVVSDRPKMRKALIDIPLRFDKNKNKTVLSHVRDEEHKSAKTEYECLEGSRVLKVRIYEGRKHQIRAHLGLALGCPILLDYQYGYKDPADEKRDSKLKHIYLHSFQSIIRSESESGRRMVKHIQNRLLEQEDYQNVGEEALIKNHEGEVRIRKDEVVLRARLPDYIQ